MEDFRIALVQHASPVRSTQKNLEATEAWARKAKKAGADLVVLPELNITGHAGHAAMVAQAEPVPDGPRCERLIELARELDVFICAGLAEDDLGIHYNTMAMLGPEGYVGRQRKTHLSRDEYYYFRAGTDLPVFDLPFARVGVIICYDNSHPEISRCLAVRGAEVLLGPHAARFGAWPRTPVGRREAVKGIKGRWRRLHSTRAYDSGVYVALCNTAGRSAQGLKGVEANHAGGCMVISPDGEVVAESRSRDIRDEMVVVDLEAEAVHARRRQACFPLQTRRPEVFTALTGPTE